MTSIHTPLPFWRPWWKRGIILFQCRLKYYIFKVIYLTNLKRMLSHNPHLHVYKSTYTPLASFIWHNDFIITLGQKYFRVPVKTELFLFSIINWIETCLRFQSRTISCSRSLWVNLLLYCHGLNSHYFWK